MNADVADDAAFSASAGASLARPAVTVTIGAGAMYFSATAVFPVSQADRKIGRATARASGPKDFAKDFEIAMPVP